MTMLSSGFDKSRFNQYSKLANGQGFVLSPKLDGIRCVIVEPKWSAKTNSTETVWSRNGKPIANRYIRSFLADLPIGCDGELCTDPANDPEAFSKSQTIATTIDMVPENWCYYIFNFAPPGCDDKPYFERMAMLQEHDLTKYGDKVQILPTVHCESVEQIQEYTAKCYEAGYEGAMLTTNNAPYLRGKRCSSTKPWSLKLKPMEDAEFKVVGFIEAIYRGTKTIAKELQGTSKGELGALVLRDPSGKFLDFDCGSGFTAEQRQDIWQNQEAYLGRLATIKYQATGSTDRPRLPIFKAFRDY